MERPFFSNENSVPSSRDQAANQDNFDRRKVEEIRKELEHLRNQLAEKDAQIAVQAMRIAELEGHVLDVDAKHREAQDKVLHFKEMSERDALTGLPNLSAFLKMHKQFIDLNAREHYQDTVTGAHHESNLEREKQPLRSYSILAFDLDGFKAVNDTFGHEAGNVCLKILAEEVLLVVRGTDYFAREGGDEFLILLPNVGENGGRVVGEKILDTIEGSVNERLKDYLMSEGVVLSDYNDVTVSASIGVVGFGDKTAEKEVDEEDMVKIADYIRYVVKAAGKRAVLTLKEAREIDSDNKLWNQYVKSVQSKGAHK